MNVRHYAADCTVLHALVIMLGVATSEHGMQGAAKKKRLVSFAT